MAIVLFLRFYGPRLRLGPQKRKKRTRPISSHLDLALGQYIRMTTSRRKRELCRTEFLNFDSGLNPLNFTNSTYLLALGLL